ncbi:MAG: DUF948 domain-containing protein [Nitrospirota bacterium]
MLNNIWAGIIIFLLVLATAFIVILVIELKLIARSLREFLKTTENDIKPTLEELRETLKSIRKVSDDINDVTGDIKTFSGSIRDVGLNIKHASNVIEGFTSSTAIKASGLRVGIKTALMFLLNSIYLKKGGEK